MLAIEAPLELRVAWEGGDEAFTVTMRTPGEDEDLALGLLLTERVVASPLDIERIAGCASSPNVVRAWLRAGVVPRLPETVRRLASTASCGLCGKRSADGIGVAAATPPDGMPPCTPRVAATLLQSLPARMRERQAGFESTGSLHAVAAFGVDGELRALREDIGRHNALDKLLGALWRDAAHTLPQTLLALSGRAGYELVQKAEVAGVPIVVAVGAPSSLAVETAERAGITLVGFLRADGFNVYSHPQRVGAP